MKFIDDDDDDDDDSRLATAKFLFPSTLLIISTDSMSRLQLLLAGNRPVS